MERLNSNSPMKCTEGGEQCKINMCSRFTENKSSIAEEDNKLLEQKRFFMDKLEDKFQQSTRHISFFN